MGLALATQADISSDRLYAERTANRREVEKMSGMSDLGPVVQSCVGEYHIASKSMCATFCD